MLQVVEGNKNTKMGAQLQGRGRRGKGGGADELLDGLVFKGSCKYFVFVLSGLTDEGFDHPRTIASKKTLCIPGWGPRFSEYV